MEYGTIFDNHKKAKKLLHNYKTMSSTSFWSFVTLKNYTKTPMPLEEKVRSGFMSFFRKFRSEEKEYAFPTTEKTLTHFSDYQLNRLVPYPDWSQRVQALDETLKDWKSSSLQKNNIVFVLCPPLDAVQEVVALWGKQNHWEVLHEYPPVNSILSGDISWGKDLLTVKQGLVIPHLERLYFRQTHGLKLLRKILNSFGSTPCKVLIGVDSWTWSYLKHALNIEGHAIMVLIPQALKEQDLVQWFRQLLKNKLNVDIVVRLTNTGNYVLKTGQQQEVNKELTMDRKILSRLATHSQGSGLLAWRLFRDNLRTQPDVETFSEQEEQVNTGQSNRVVTVWLNPWENIPKPTIPTNIPRSDVFILHCLLLHNGLEASILEKLLPISTSETTQSLNRLQLNNLVEIHEEPSLWKIRPCAYLAIKNYLASEGYLTDNLREDM